MSQPLTAQLKWKGYSKTRQVADNDSDEGHAKYRRVEISRADCAKWRGMAAVIASVPPADTADGPS